MKKTKAKKTTPRKKGESVLTKNLSDLREGFSDLFGSEGQSVNADRVLSKVRSSNDLVIIDEILNGIIKTKQKTYFIPLFLDVKESIEYKDNDMARINMDKFRTVLLNVSDKTHIKIVYSKYNKEKLLNQLLIEENDNPDWNGLKNAYKNNVSKFVTSRFIKTSFFVLLEYIPTGGVLVATEEVEIIKELLLQKETLVSSLKSLNIDVLQKTDREILEFYYRYFNPKTEFSFDMRVKRIFADANELFKNDNLSVAELIAPVGANFGLSPYYCVVDGEYQTSFIIQGGSYTPGEIYMKQFFGLNLKMVGVEIDMFIHKRNKRSVKRGLAVSKRLASTKLNQQGDKAYVETSIKQGDTPMSFFIMYTVKADTEEELYVKFRRLMSVLEGRGYKGNPLIYRQSEAFLFRSMQPLVSNALYKIGRKDVMLSDFVVYNPFDSLKEDDEGGTVIGITQNNADLIKINPFDTTKFSNANISIIGSSGSGKTFSLQTMAIRFRLTGMSVSTIVPEKAHEWKMACDKLGGEFINLSSGSEDHVNLFDIVPLSKEALRRAKIVDNMDNDSISLLTLKVERLEKILSLIVPALATPGSKERLYINPLLIELYNSFGITDDNDSLYKDKQKPEDGVKDMPILGDLYNFCLKKQKADKQGVYTVELDNIIKSLEPFINGSKQAFNHKTTVDFGNKYIVASIENLQTDMKVLGMQIITDRLFSKIKEDRSENKLLLVEEGSTLINSNVPDELAAMMRDTVKLIRGYGAGFIFATQEFRDFFSKDNGAYGASILSNSDTKLLFGIKPNDLTDIKKYAGIGITKNMESLLLKYKRGQCLYMYKDNIIPIQIVASELEQKYIDTTADAAKKLVEEHDNKLLLTQ